MANQAAEKEFPSREERVAMATKQGTSELVVYLALCKKLNREPAPSAVKRQQQFERRAAKRATAKK